MLQRLDDGIELHVVGQVSESDVIQLLAKELYGVAILAKDTPDANAGRIASDFEHFAEVR